MVQNLVVNATSEGPGLIFDRPLSEAENLFPNLVTVQDFGDDDDADNAASATSEASEPTVKDTKHFCITADEVIEDVRSKTKELENMCSDMYDSAAIAAGLPASSKRPESKLHTGTDEVDNQVMRWAGDGISWYLEAKTGTQTLSRDTEAVRKQRKSTHRC